MKVAALSQNYIYNYVYISPETWKLDNGSDPVYKSIYIHASEGAQENRELSEKLLACDIVSAVAVNADMLSQINKMMGSLDAVVLLVIPVSYTHLDVYKRQGCAAGRADRL